MAKKLYVDMISADRGSAVVMHRLSISYNLIITGRWGDENASPIFQAGKFICCVFGNEKNDLGMSILDPVLNERMALDFANDELHPEYVRKGLHGMIEHIKATHSAVKDEYELIVGLAPAMPLNQDN